MKSFKTDVIIIGAGLTGLTLAYYLRQLNISVRILEATNNIGGRIKTKYNDNKAPVELGATWIINQQINTLALLEQLGLSVFEQHYGNTAIYHPNETQAAQLVQLPNNNSTSFRITNGTYSLVKTLAKKLEKNTISHNQIVKSITLTSNGLNVTTNNTTYHSKQVVTTLPPLLFSKCIGIESHLPKDVEELLMNTHTWMHNSIRIGFTYKNPFWQGQRTTGTIYSSVGIIQEFYDHSNSDNDLYALGGFIKSEFSYFTKEERKDLALKQLVNYYGDQALEYESYEECVWVNEKYTAVASDRFLMPQANNGHPLFQKSYLNNRLFFAGAETSSVFSGKMEGAVTSAQNVFKKLKAIYI